MKSGDLCKILMACIGASVPKTTSNHLWMTYLQMCIVRLRNITEPITFLLRNIHINKYPRKSPYIYLHYGMRETINIEGRGDGF